MFNDYEWPDQGRDSEECRQVSESVLWDWAFWLTVIFALVVVVTYTEAP